jgi:DNA-binding FadR family transcriptional regulator
MSRLERPGIGRVPFAEAIHDLTNKLAIMSGNRAIALFLMAIHRLVMETSRFESVSPENFSRGVTLELGVLRNILNSIFAGNAAGAHVAAEASLQFHQSHMLDTMRTLDAEDRSVRESNRAALNAEMTASPKANMAPILTRLILREVCSQPWSRGKYLGTEADYIKRFGISRLVFRSALRLLERYGIVEVRRGKKGGIFVGQPDPAVAVKLARQYLNCGFDTRAALDARQVLEPAAFAGLASTCTSLQADVLRGALFGSGDECLGTRFLLAIEPMLPDRLAALFLKIVWESSPPLPNNPAAPAMLQDVVDALTSGDVIRTERYTRRYLSSFSTLTSPVS